MKKFFAMILALSMVLCLVACGQNEQPAASAGSEEESSISGTVVVCSSATELDLEAIQVGFEEKYPDCTVEFVTCSAGEGVERVQAEGDNPSIDVFYSGLNQADGDKYADFFEPYVSSYDATLPEQYQSNNGYYNYDHLSTICFCVNTELEAELGLDIKGYADLLDPKLNGKILLSDPTSSSAAWNNLSNIFTVFGEDSEESWNLLDGLLANGMVIGSSSSACFKSVQDGEYVVGLTYEDGASTLIKAGAENVKMVYPAEGASAFAFAAAIVKNAPNMDAAKAMIEWLQSPEGQSFRANYVGTVRFTNPDVVVENSYLPAEDTITWVTRDIDWLIANKTAMLDKWTALYQKYAG